MALSIYMLIFVTCSIILGLCLIYVIMQLHVSYDIM